MDTNSTQSDIESAITAAINEMDNEELVKLDVMKMGMAYFPERGRCFVGAAFTDVNWSNPAFTIPWKANNGPGLLVMLPRGSAIDYEALDGGSDELEQIMSDEATIRRLALIIRRELLANVTAAAEILLDSVVGYLSEQD